MNEDNTVEEVLDSVSHSILNFFDNNKFSVDSMSSWQTPLHLGKDCVFHERSGAPQHTCNLYVSTMVFKEDKAVIINIMQLKGGERTLISSHQISLARIEVEIRDKLASSLTKIGFLSLPQLLQMRLIRNSIVNHLPVKDLLHLEATCKLVRDICSMREVDQFYWKKQLKKTFDKDKDDIYTSYREAYKHEVARRKQSTEFIGIDPLRVYDPLRDNRPGLLPRRPLIPDPLFPESNPFAPGIFGDPFSGGPGLGSEFMPSRPRRFPNPRGPPMGPSGWPQFDDNAFI